VHGPLRLVELQAVRLEFETAEIQDAAYVRLEVVDDILVLDAEHLASKGVVPMRHQLEVGAVIAGDVFDAVGELLPRGKQLLEVAEAAGHRLAARVDDPGVREHELDQTQMPEIIRHLVDEVGLARAVDARVLKVFFAKSFAFLGGELCEYARVSGIPRIRLAPLQVLHEPRYVRELHRALYLGV